MINPISYISYLYNKLKASLRTAVADYKTDNDRPTITATHYDDLDNIDLLSVVPFEEAKLTSHDDAMTCAQQLRAEGGRSCYAITKIINDAGYKVSQSTVTRWVREVVFYAD